MPTPCSDCTQNIGLFKRKQKCENCHAIFCDKCFGKSFKIVMRETMSSNHCLKCNIFGLSCFRREELLLLSTKDLRYFLCSKNIPTQHCKERFHLVDLIMKFAEQTGQKSMTDIRREEARRMHVENLRMAAQRREEREAEEVIFRATASQVNLPGTPLETPRSNLTNKWKSIEDIASADDVESLSNIELKKILTVNFVDYKGCVEKSELIEKVKRLWNSQNTSQKAKPKEPDDDEDEEIYDEDLCKNLYGFKNQLRFIRLWSPGHMYKMWTAIG